MKEKRLQLYAGFALLGVLAASAYPLYMGVQVVADMLRDGAVMKENYPKYIIPYTPIAVAVLVGVLAMPLLVKGCRRFALAIGSALSTAVFFAVELLFERRVVISVAETVTRLEDWQMFMCYVPAGGWGETVTTYKDLTPVEILMGEYSPAFKLHFYLISLLLILSALRCLYGFADVIAGGKGTRRVLGLQAVASAAFLGLCILACFTAFWRDGALEVSPCSATLMTAFFALMGMVGGIYVGSFLLGRTGRWAVLLPAFVASGVVLLMYVGEMILLQGNLYVLGEGWLFAALPGIVLSVFDLLVIAASGVLTAALLRAFGRKT